MIFQNIRVGSNTPINKTLFDKMARNDDILKLYYESCRTGVIAWQEIEQAIYVSTRLTPEQVAAGDLGEGEDPTWATISTLPIVVENRRVVKIMTSAFFNIHQSTSDIPTTYRENIRIRYTIEYPAEEPAPENSNAAAITLIPYLYISNGDFSSANQTKEYGRIYAQNIVISTNDYLLNKSDNNRIAKYQKYNLIKPGKAFVNVQVRKQDVPQNIYASAENKMQIIIEDCGAWR